MQTNLDRYISNLSCDDCPAKSFSIVAKCFRQNVKSLRGEKDEQK